MKRPNILLLLADQHRGDCCGFMGKYPVKTPNIDALAKEGTAFLRAYTPAPVCAPARQALLSGLDPNSFGALWNYDFIPTKTLAPGETWSEKLADAGYSCAFLGKWHSSPEHGPRAFGYGDDIGFGEYSAGIKAQYPDYKKTGGWFGAESPLPAEDSPSHYLAAKAAELIEKYREAGRPWHIRVDFNEPHLPCNPSKPFSDMYRPEDIPEWDGFGDSFEQKPYIQAQQLRNWGIEGMDWKAWAPAVARYYAVVSQLDDAVGVILRALEASGMAEDTMVLYTSDHGDMCGSHGMLDKHYVLYEDNTRVPLIIRWPGFARAGAREDAFVSNCLDLAPTVCEAAGLARGKEHGASLLPLLCGEKPEGWREAVTSGSNGQQFGLFVNRMYRDERYKYIWNPTDTDELYDLCEDPGEKKNLIRAPEHAERIAVMRRALHAVLKRQEDVFARTGWLDRQLLDGRKY